MDKKSMLLFCLLNLIGLFVGSSIVLAESERAPRLQINNPVGNNLTAIEMGSCCCQQSTIVTCTFPQLCTLITTPTTITSPGAYCVANTINGTITIASDNVDLNIGGHLIEGATVGIEVVPSCHNLKIHDGFINDIEEQGILVGSGASDIIIENVVITNAGSDTNPFALQAQGGDTFIINNCTISLCLSGISLTNVNQSRITNCIVSNCTTDTTSFIGILIDGSSTGHYIRECTIIDNASSAGDAHGISLIATQGAWCSQCFISNLSGLLIANGLALCITSDSTLSECTVNNINVIGSDVDQSFARGIHTAVETNCVFKDCVIQGIATNSSPSHAFGVNITGGETFSLENIVVEGIATSTTWTVGFQIQAVDCILKDCSCINLAGDDTTAGFFVMTSTVSLDSCKVEELVGTTTAYGYYLQGTGTLISTFSLFNCQAQTVESDNSYGFYTINTVAIFNKCNALFIIGNTLARGFSFGASAQPANINLYECQANFMAASGQNATGIFLQDSIFIVQQCSSSNFFGANRGVGIHISTGGNGSIYETRTGNMAGGAEAYGFMIEDEAFIANSRALNISSGGIGAGFRLLSSVNNSILNNCLIHDIFAVTGYGILIEGNNIQANSCAVDDIVNGSGIEIAPTANNCTVVECQAENNNNGIVNTGNNSVVCDCFAAHNSTNYIGVANTVTPGSATIVCGNTDA